MPIRQDWSNTGKYWSSNLHNQHTFHLSVNYFFDSTGSFWAKVTPWALRKTVNWIKNSYGDVPIYVTSNGVSDNTGELEDNDRVEYFRQYIDEALKGRVELLNIIILTLFSKGMLEKYNKFAFYNLDTVITETYSKISFNV